MKRKTTREKPLDMIISLFQILFHIANIPHTFSIFLKLVPSISWKGVSMCLLFLLPVNVYLGSLVFMLLLSACFILTRMFHLACKLSENICFASVHVDNFIGDVCNTSKNEMDSQSREEHVAKRLGCPLHSSWYVSSITASSRNGQIECVFRGWLLVA